MAALNNRTIHIGFKGQSEAHSKCFAFLVSGEIRAGADAARVKDRPWCGGGLGVGVDSG
jgi:hypothetical protein